MGLLQARYNLFKKMKDPKEKVSTLKERLGEYNTHYQFDRKAEVINLLNQHNIFRVNMNLKSIEKEIDYLRFLN